MHRLLPLALAALLLPLSALADYDTETVDGIPWTYTISDGKAEISTSDGSAAIPPSTTGAIAIPSTFGGCPVTSVGFKAFYECSGLTSVTIPDSVTGIEWGAFYGCSGLASMTIPDSVTSIGLYAFNDCSALSSVTIPDSVTSVGYGAFNNCHPALYDTTTIPGVKLVDGWAKACEESFSGSLDLTGIRGIIPHAFNGCSGLTSVTIPDSVRIIEYEAFYGCSGLPSVTIPNSVTNIGFGAFEGCSGLASVTIPDSVRRIEYRAFKDCHPALYDTTTIPGVTLVDGWAIDYKESFSGSLDLTGIRGIGNSAFSGCSGLTSVTIPDSVTSISGGAFSRCRGLLSLTIPDSVTSIGYDAFEECSGLTSLTIPDSVTSIGENAFEDCSGLAKLDLPRRFEGKTDNMGIPKGCEVVFHDDAPATYTVAFAANGGTGTMAPLTPTVGETITLPKCTFTRKGYVFAGWALTEKGEVASADEALATYDGGAGETVTLYAQWAKKNYKVKFYANGGKGKMAVEKMTYGNAKKLSKNKFKRSGYTFKGWAKSKKLAKKGTVAYKNKKKVKNLTMTGKTVKLYAVWKRR